MNSRKTSGTVTFHASHNYGSVLQAYALQKTIEKLGVDNEIINLRTERQKDTYRVFTKRKGVKYLIKNFTHLLYFKKLKEKYCKFEDFINNELILSEKEFATSEEIKASGKTYDYYVAGSDQIWNPIPLDFDWAYYLDFVKTGKRISYAPSFGPLSSLSDSEARDKMASYLEKFDSISVREEGSREAVLKLSGKNVPTVCDPTLLLSEEEWTSLAENGEKPKGEYIFFYTLFADKEMMKMAKTLSKSLNLPVVVSNFSNQYDVINGFKKHYNAGPKDFLSLIRNAKFVFVSSFHGTVFSIMFKKPFFAIRGMKDARIKTLLESFSLCDRAVDINDIEEKCNNAFDVDFKDCDKYLEELREKGLEFLKQSLEVE